MRHKGPRHASIALRLLVSTRFQVLFHSPPAVLFPFPSRYWFTIGHSEVFSLGRWSSQIPTEFHVFRCTQDPLQRKFLFDYRAITFYGWSFQTDSSKEFLCNSYVECPTTPEIKDFWFGLFPVRSPLLRKSIFLSFPLGTKMFQFPRYAPCILLDSDTSTAPLRTVDFPIRKSPVQCLLTARRCISVIVPSIIGS